MTTKQPDKIAINNHFVDFDKVLKEIENSTSDIMPLVSESIALTRKILKVYKKAFTAGI